MPYRFKFSESAGKSFRRIAVEQCSIVRAALPEASRSVTSLHDARKALKRLRALVAAAAPAIGAKTSRKLNRELRDVARLLAPRRDADVALETLAKLDALENPEAASALAQLRSSLARMFSHVETEKADDAHQAAADALKAVNRDLAKVRLKGRGMPAVFDGMKVAYCKGRDAIQNAYRSPTDENFHDLRKQVQLHWRHMALLARAWPEAFGVRVDEARALSQMLGDDHDFAVLKMIAAAELSDIDSATVAALCDTQQAAVRAEVRGRVERLFADKPAAFAAMLAATWKAGQRMSARAKAVARSEEIRQIGGSSAPRLALPSKSKSQGAAATGSPPDAAAKTRSKASSQDGS